MKTAIERSRTDYRLLDAVRELPAGSSDKPKGLTRRSLEVLVGLASSKTMKEIALELGISVKAVEWHRWRLGLLGLRDVASMTRYAIKEGWVNP